MSQHTPGPWIYSSGMVWAGDGEEIPIAYMDRETPHTKPVERDANARLIAKAPEMLALLRAAVFNPNLMTRHKGELCSGKLQCGICTAHALLREIEGE